MKDVYLTFTKWKLIICKGPKIVSYWNYKNSSNYVFQKLLLDEFAKIQIFNELPALQTYLHVCVRALDKYSPKNSKCVGANNSSFMNKKNLKVILDCTRLRNKFLKNWYPEKRFADNQQRNF